jgi:DNA polymerase III alpha subunit
MNGSVEHYKACVAAGIKPIIGLEAYLVDDRAARADRVRRLLPTRRIRDRR